MPEEEAADTKIVWWILGALGAILLAVSGGWANYVLNALSTHEKEISEMHTVDASQTLNLNQASKDMQETKGDVKDLKKSVDQIQKDVTNTQYGIQDIQKTLEEFKNNRDRSH